MFVHYLSIFGLIFCVFSVFGQFSLTVILINDHWKYNSFHKTMEDMIHTHYVIAWSTCFGAKSRGNHYLHALNIIAESKKSTETLALHQKMSSRKLFNFRMDEIWDKTHTTMKITRKNRSQCKQKVLNKE